MKLYSEEDLLAMFQAAIDKAGGVRKLAHKLNLSPAYICDIRLRRRNIGAASILRFLGVERVYQPIRYRKAAR